DPRRVALPPCVRWRWVRRGGGSAATDRGRAGLRAALLARLRPEPAGLQAAVRSRERAAEQPCRRLARPASAHLGSDIRRDPGALYLLAGREPFDAAALVAGSLVPYRWIRRPARDASPLVVAPGDGSGHRSGHPGLPRVPDRCPLPSPGATTRGEARSEEHTSELQS